MKQMAKTKCPQCGTRLEKVRFDVSYGVKVESMHCRQCGFNITDDQKLTSALASLRERMSKEVKIVKVGSGLGVRFPNELVRILNLRKGKEVVVRPEADGLRLVVG